MGTLKLASNLTALKVLNCFPEPDKVVDAEVLMGLLTAMPRGSVELGVSPAVREQVLKRLKAWRPSRSIS
jgi:hypothetical protein